MKTTSSAASRTNPGQVLPAKAGFAYRTIAICPEFADVAGTFLVLNNEGFGNDQISLLGQEREHWQERLGKEWETLKTARGAAEGAALGAIPGLVLVTGIALTGGVGVLVAGPLIAGMSALGLGSLAGGLMGAGVSSIDSAEKTSKVEEQVAEAIKHGQWVVVDHSHTDSEATHAQRLLPKSRIVRDDD